MKISIEFDDGKGVTYEDVTDAYLAVRQQKPAANKRGEFALLSETRSFSWGGNIRELAKELAQSQIELQEILKEQKHGGSS